MRPQGFRIGVAARLRRRSCWDPSKGLEKITKVGKRGRSLDEAGRENLFQVDEIIGEVEEGFIDVGECD